MKIAAFPAFKTKQNPYQSLLYAAMQKQKITVEEFHWKNLLFKKYDIIHIHWPESNKLRQTVLIALSYIIIFNSLLKIAKLKGAKIVWTVHNFQSHEKKFPVLESIHFKFFTRMVDGIIIMNRSTDKKLISTYPFLKHKPLTVIPHGHYKDYYENKISASKARSLFKVSEADKVFLVLGQIRPYKGLEHLIEHFKKEPDLNYKFIIAGNVNKEATLYKKMLEKLIANDSRMIFNPQFIPDNELQNYFNAADVILLPYTDLLNSGVLLLALSFNKTILMPYFDSVEEIVEKYNDWILTYESLDNFALQEALIRSAFNKGRTTDMESINWNAIALQTIDFYNCLLN